MNQLIGSEWIAYVGAIRFPYGEAGSRRVYGMARSLVHAGRNVVVCSGESQPASPLVVFQGRRAALSHAGLGEIPDHVRPSPERAARWLLNLGASTVRWLSEQPSKPTCVISYGDNAAFAFRLLRWCRRNKVPLVFDVVEWYDPSHVLGGRFGPLNASAKIALRWLYPRANGIIAISSYLEDYYRRQKCTTLRVPPTLDVSATEPRMSVSSSCKGSLVLAYAGVPGKKDMLDNVADAVLRLNAKGKRVRFILAGPTARQVLQLPSLKARALSSLPECLSAIGPQSYSNVVKLVRDATFTPLLRPQLRYAQAGFPTKVTESLAVGTPVLCNLTSDLGFYLHDGVEGLICRDVTVDIVEEALERALQLTPVQLSAMRSSSREQALQSFDFRRYADPLADFLGRLP